MERTSQPPPPYPISNALQQRIGSRKHTKVCAIFSMSKAQSFWGSLLVTEQPVWVKCAAIFKVHIIFFFAPWSTQHSNTQCTERIHCSGPGWFKFPTKVARHVSWKPSNNRRNRVVVPYFTVAIYLMLLPYWFGCRKCILAWHMLETFIQRGWWLLTHVVSIIKRYPGH